jgi:hypothetical protein
LQEDSVIRNFRITADDDKTYDTLHYNLSAIIESFTIKGFAMVQNKLHWAIHGQAAAEVIYHRADADKVTAEIAHTHVESEFEKYRIVQDRLYVSDFDTEVQKLENGRFDDKMDQDT